MAARPAIPSVLNLDYAVRQTSETEEKEAIGEAIAAQIPDNSSVFISIGTTTETIAKHLLQQNWTTDHHQQLACCQRALSKPGTSMSWCPAANCAAPNGGILGSTGAGFHKPFPRRLSDHQLRLD